MFKLLKRNKLKNVVEREDKNEVSQQGMTLLEVIIVLGIVGVISAGVITLAQRAFDSQTYNKATENLNSTQLAFAQTYRATGSYPAAASLADGEKLTNALIRLGTIGKADAMNPFANELMPILTFARNAKVNKAFALVVSGLDEAQCRALVIRAEPMFSYIQVATDATTAPPTDLTTQADATKAIGVIKSPNTGSVNFNVSDIAHTDVLCNGATALFLGNA